MKDLADSAVRVRLLLETLNDPYPTPRSALATDSGPAPSRYVPCEHCKRRGEVRQRSGWSLCLVCDGRGWRRRGAGEPAWDAYVELPLVEAATMPRESAMRSQLSEEMREQTYGWERLRRAYDRHGSYQAVRVQLDWLSIVSPRRFRLVRTVLVDHEPRTLSVELGTELDLGVVMIARRINPVRVPPWLIEQSAAEAKRSTIEALAADGFTAGQIARRLGVTKESVRRKLKGKAVESAVAGIPARAM